MWQNRNDQLYKKFVFKDFNEAIVFINKIADLATKANHHPTIKNTYNTVELWLSTRDKGDKVTEKDKQLAKDIDALGEYNG